MDFEMAFSRLWKACDFKKISSILSHPTVEDDKAICVGLSIWAENSGKRAKKPRISAKALEIQKTSLFGQGENQERSSVRASAAIMSSWEARWGKFAGEEDNDAHLLSAMGTNQWVDLLFG